MDFGDLFSFEKRLAPQIIKPIYWIGIVLVVLYGIIMFLYGMGWLFSSFSTGLGVMFGAILTVIFGILGLRIGAEVTLAVFEIHEKVGATTGGTATTTTTTTPS
jgi:apolipoprotein N-acyltransferase